MNHTHRKVLRGDKHVSKEWFDFHAHIYADWCNKFYRVTSKKLVMIATENRFSLCWTILISLQTTSMKQSVLERGRQSNPVEGIAILVWRDLVSIPGFPSIQLPPPDIQNFIHKRGLSDHIALLLSRWRNRDKGRSGFPGSKRSQTRIPALSWSLHSLMNDPSIHGWKWSHIDTSPCHGKL